jgi:predicted ABC-type transport system involved in lysophospholipase L1 biosynthesis ATPase subunit
MVTHDPEIGLRARRQLRMVDGRLDIDQRNTEQRTEDAS